eukprot:m.753672 g.753672  ORF g.753672 m.753672 type:complete len:94 (-) comp23173_c0_seq6:86-367(-)
MKTVGLGLDDGFALRHTRVVHAQKHCCCAGRILVLLDTTAGIPATTISVDRNSRIKRITHGNTSMSQGSASGRVTRGHSASVGTTCPSVHVNT